MTKEQEYKLKFIKVVDGSIYYYCEMVETNQEFNALSELLNIISNKAPEALLDEIQSAMNGDDFEEIFSFDAAPGDFGLYITPQNVRIELFGYTYIILLIDLKELLEERTEFVEQLHKKR